MVLKRNQFYLLLLGLFISPFILYKIGWLAFSKKTTGTVEYIGETRGRRIGRQAYPVVQFTTDSKHVVTISGDYNLPYAPGDDYPIRYNRFNETDARLDTFWGCWIETVIWSIIVFVIISIIFIRPDIVPKEKLIKIRRYHLEFID
jgi:hypothetical protein